MLTHILYLLVGMMIGLVIGVFGMAVCSCAKCNDCKWGDHDLL